MKKLYFLTSLCCILLYNSASAIVQLTAFSINEADNDRNIFVSNTSSKTCTYFLTFTRSPNIENYPPFESVSLLKIQVIYIINGSETPLTPQIDILNGWPNNSYYYNYANQFTIPSGLTNGEVFIRFWHRSSLGNFEQTSRSNPFYTKPLVCEIVFDITGPSVVEWSRATFRVQPLPSPYQNSSFYQWRVRDLNGVDITSTLHFGDMGNTLEYEAGLQRPGTYYFECRTQGIGCYGPWASKLVTFL